MSRRGRSVLLLLLAALLLPSPLPGQGEDPLARALTAYRDLDFEAAAARFRTALNASGQNRLGDSDRVRALMHLGATELFRTRRDAATEAFRALLLLDPRYRPDELVFPPEVSAAFGEVRLGVRAVSVVIPPETQLLAASDRLPIRIYASSLHELRVHVVGTDAVRVTDVLHDGGVGDSLEVLWSARDSTGRARESGRYSLRIISRAPNGRDEREVRIPIDIERLAADTLPWPLPLDPTQLRPETAEARRTVRPLLVGLAIGLGATGLPAVAGAANEGSPLRFGLAGLAGLAGIAGVIRSSRPSPIAENIEWNRAQQAQRAAELERVRRENETRRSSARLRLRAGRAVVSEIR